MKEKNLLFGIVILCFGMLVYLGYIGITHHYSYDYHLGNTKSSVKLLEKVEPGYITIDDSTKFFVNDVAYSIRLVGNDYKLFVFEKTGDSIILNRSEVLTLSKKMRDRFREIVKANTEKRNQAKQAILDEV